MSTHLRRAGLPATNTGLPARDSDTQRAERARWADTAKPIACAGCGTEFAPKHPRQRYCKAPECPGRRAPSGRRRNGPSGHAVEAARRIGVQGVLADVLLHTHTADDLDGRIAEIREAVHAWVAAEATRRPREVHAALIRLQAACAIRTLTVAPPPAPPPAEDDEPPV